MILTLIALVSGLALGILLFKLSVDRYEGLATFYCVFSFLLSLFCGVGLLLLSISSFMYVSADYKKDIINREFGTNYTQDEVFYASDVIDTIREIKRTRVEVNGDLLRNDKN